MPTHRHGLKKSLRVLQPFAPQAVRYPWGVASGTVDEIGDVIGVGYTESQKNNTSEVACKALCSGSVQASHHQPGCARCAT